MESGRGSIENLAGNMSALTLEELEDECSKLEAQNCRLIRHGYSLTIVNDNTRRILELRARISEMMERGQHENVQFQFQNPHGVFVGNRFGPASGPAARSRHVEAVICQLANLIQDGGRWEFISPVFLTSEEIFAKLRSIFQVIVEQQQHQPEVGGGPGGVGAVGGGGGSRTVSSPEPGQGQPVMGFYIRGNDGVVATVCVPVNPGDRLRFESPENGPSPNFGNGTGTVENRCTCPVHPNNSHLYPGNYGGHGGWGMLTPNIPQAAPPHSFVPVAPVPVAPFPGPPAPWHAAGASAFHAVRWPPLQMPPFPHFPTPIRNDLRRYPCPCHYCPFCFAASSSTPIQPPAQPPPARPPSMSTLTIQPGHGPAGSNSNDSQIQIRFGSNLGIQFGLQNMPPELAPDLDRANHVVDDYDDYGGEMLPARGHGDDDAVVVDDDDDASSFNSVEIVDAEP